MRTCRIARIIEQASGMIHRQTCLGMTMAVDRGALAPAPGAQLVAKGAQDMKLEGKVALVTGSGDGLGRGIALALAREGAMVVVNEIAEGRIQEALHK
jgi:5,10-methylene-tetrahydrofolate dehydrogenase/methenyl tetrahydrofolate cyclohydrolase